MHESESLASVGATASGAEQKALFRRSWSALLSALAILQRRLTDNTLLPGTVRKEEADFCAHVQAETCVAQNEAVPPTEVLESLCQMIGYDVLIGALYRSLNLVLTSFQSW